MASLTKEALERAITQIRALTVKQADRLAYEAIAFNSFPGFVVKKGAAPRDLAEIQLSPGAIIPAERLAPSVEDLAGPSLMERARFEVEEIARGFDERWKAYEHMADDTIVLSHPEIPGEIVVTRDEACDNLHFRKVTKILRLRHAEREQQMRWAREAAGRRENEERARVEEAGAKAKRWREDPPHRILAPRAPGHI